MSAMARVALLLGFIGAALASPARVSLYMSEGLEVMDLSWDNGPAHLASQLVTSDFSVEPAHDGQPELTGAVNAYVVPAQNGQAMYSEVEDMTKVASYVAQGGLVVVLGANTGDGEALRSFVSKALRLDGDWGLCKQFATNSRTSLGEPTVSKRASSFLSGEWPATLEDAQVTSVMSWCQHNDPSAASVPLYTVAGDEKKTVAQAFTKAGTSGAVVWIGYSWKDGMQENWGAMLQKIIADFAPVESHSQVAAEEYSQGDISSLIEVVAQAAADASQMARRWLQGGYYPSPSPSPVPSIVIVPVAPSPSSSPSPAPVPAKVTFSGKIKLSGNGLDPSSGTVCACLMAKITTIKTCLTTTFSKDGKEVTFSVELTPWPPTTVQQLQDTLNALLASPSGLAVFSQFCIDNYGIIEITGTTVITGVSPTPAPTPAPTTSPTPAPTTSPAPSSPSGNFVPFFSIAPRCSVGTSKALVCWGDSDYQQQRSIWSASNLINNKLKPCKKNPSKECYGCPRAFRTWDSKTNTSITTLALYFKDAVQITEFTYIFTKNPNLIKVELLEYPVVGLSSGNPSPKGKVTVWEGAEDPAKCGVATTIKIPNSISHVSEPVPSVADLPSKAYGGVLLTFKSVRRDNKAGLLYSTVFTGRALYPTTTYMKRK